MDDYIKREDFISRYRKLFCEDCNRRKGLKNRKMRVLYEIGDAPCRACDIGDMLDYVENAPAADVAEVRHGRWIGYPECLKYPNAYSDDHIVCSACEECFSILDNDCERFNYCPNCGARMDGGEDDEAD